MAEGTNWPARRLQKREEPRLWQDVKDDVTYLDANFEVRGDVIANGVLLGAGGGAHPDLATHDALGLATDAELAGHAAAGDPHTVYATNAELDLHTADTTDAHDASSVSVLDLAGTFDATEVETALAELTADDVAHAALPNAHHAEFTTATHSAIGDASPHHAAAHAINSANHTGTLDDAQIPATIARDAEVTTAVSDHAAAADPHTNYQRETEKGVAGGYASLDGSGLVPDAQIASTITRDSEWNGIDFLVGTATGALSGEIAVGTTPGGELGNTWASPTVDASHSGSTHAATQAAAEATASSALATHEADTTSAHKLDDLAAPDDNTDLNATTTAHGLLKKLSNVATEFMNGVGAWSTPTASVPVLVGPKNVVSTVETIAANTYVHVGRSLEITSAGSIELPATSILEITA